MSRDRYAKVTDVWFLLHQVEQLIINEPAYVHVLRNVTNCLVLVEIIQHDIEASGN